MDKTSVNKIVITIKYERKQVRLFKSSTLNCKSADYLKNKLSIAFIGGYYYNKKGKWKIFAVYITGL